MKYPISISLLSKFLILLSIQGCVKDTSKSNCGCKAVETKYNLSNIHGILSYNQYKTKWEINYQPLPGNFAHYFPCNTTHDSLNAIISIANQNQTFAVIFSGKVKGVCHGENFGIISGVTSFDYIILDSLKRN